MFPSAWASCAGTTGTGLADVSPPARFAAGGNAAGWGQGAGHGHGYTGMEGIFVKTGFIIFSGPYDPRSRKACSHLCQLIGISKALVIRRRLSYTSEVIRMRAAFLPLQIPT